MIFDSFLPINNVHALAQKRPERRRKRNAARRNDRGTQLPSVISLNILEHAESFQDNSVDANKFHHASTGFVGVNDCSDTHEFAARGLDPGPNIAVCLDDITTTKDSLSHLDPKCPVLVRNLITNHEYKYIVNDIRYAPKLLH